MLSSSTSVASVSRAQPEATPQSEVRFAQLFNYHLSGVEAAPRKLAFRPDGCLKIHTPLGKCYDVEFSKREPVETLRERISGATGVNAKEYHLTSQRGVLEDGKSLDDYELTAGSHIVLIKIRTKPVWRWKNQDNERIGVERPRRKKTANRPKSVIRRVTFATDIT